MYFYFRLFEKSVFYSKRIFNDPFKIYRPDLFELIYMMMSIMWNIKGMPTSCLLFYMYSTDLTGINESTVRTAEELQNALSRELYQYYISEKGTVNYASRMYKLHHLMDGLEVSSPSSLLVYC